MSTPFVSFAALSSIIAFLTDSLIPFVHPLLLHSLRIHLYAYLPVHLTSSTSTLILPDCLPTTVVPHALWISALGIQSIRIHVSPSVVRAIFRNGREATLWSIDEDADLKEDSTLPSIAGRAKQDLENYVNAPIRVPSLHLRPASPVLSSTSSTDSDSNSDDGYASESSMTSVSSASSASKYTHTKHAPTPNATTYIYQGGKTNVVNGGVMLSASKATAKSTFRSKPTLTARTTTARRAPSLTSNDSPYVPPRMRTLWKRSVILSPDVSDNWRKRN